MNLPFYIGRRYLFSKKSHNAINIISFISVCGITIATMALVCTLSVYNGFENMIAGMYSSFDPQLQILPAKGKVFSIDSLEVKKALQVEGIEDASQIVEENALLKYGNQQAPIIFKGVSSNFSRITDMKKLMIDGNFVLKEGDLSYGSMGVGLAAKLNARRGYLTPLQLYTPIRNARINLANPSNAFNEEELYLSGIFNLNNSTLDEDLLIIPIDIARKMLLYNIGQVSSLSLKLKKGASVETIKAQIQEVLGEKYVVKNRIEQQANTFKMMQIEKWVTFFILAFIAIIAIFNVIGSLTMLIIEKENDITTLRSLGANNDTISSIFMIEGWMISFFGAIFGVLLGLGLCYLQQQFGFLKLSNSPDQFLVKAYPVKVEFDDLMIIFGSILAIGFAAVVYPIMSLRKRLNDSFRFQN